MEVRSLPLLHLYAGWFYCAHFLSDISGRNISFSCSNLWEDTEEQLFHVLRSPEVVPLVRVDGTPLGNALPSQLVKSAEWYNWIDWEDEDIRLFDFGEGFFQGQEPERLAQPTALRVPETIFTDTFDYRVDLWRAGCIVCQQIFLRSRNTHVDINCRSMLSYSRNGHSGTLARMKRSFSK